MIKIEYVKCDSCERSNYSVLLKTKDYRFGRPDVHTIVKCRNCGLIFLNPRPTKESILELYEEEYTPANKTIAPSAKRAQLSDFKSWLKRFLPRLFGSYVPYIPMNGKVLDVGCGNGGLLEIAASMGCKVFGVEPNPKSARICSEKGLHVYCGTLEEARFPGMFFDTIIMSQVLEHVPSPTRTLREVHRIMKPGGRLCVYCPSLDSYLRTLFKRYWHGWHIPFHFYFYTHITLAKLVEDAGFKIGKVDFTTPNHYFMVSLKSYLFHSSFNFYRPYDRGAILDRPITNILLAPFLRLVDMVVKKNGDCIMLESVK